MAAAKKPVVADVETAVQAALAPMNSFGEKVRETAEKGLEQIRTQYESVKEAAEQAQGKIEESLNAAKTGAVAFNTKALEQARANINATFDHVSAVLNVKSMQDFVSLQTEFAKTQLASVQEQVKELAAIGQKAVADAAEPVKNAIPFKK
jgi:phasin